MDPKELRDVTIAYFVLLAMFARLNVHDMIILALPLFTAFILHEYGHIFMAKKYGYYARFVMWPKAIVYSIILYVVTLGHFVFAVPGAATIFTPFEIPKKQNTWIAAAGPIVNTINGLLSLVLSLVYPSQIFIYTVLLNSWIAMFNLLPVYPLDGSKIIRGNVLLWLVLLAVNIGTFIFGLTMPVTPLQ